MPATLEGKAAMCINHKKWICIVLVLASTALTQCTFSPKENSLPDASKDEYAVAAAILESIYPSNSKKWVMLAAHSSTFACNPPVNSGLNIGSCSGMRSIELEPEQVLADVQSAIPAIPQELLDNFIKSVSDSVTLSHTLPTKIFQVLYAPDMKSNIPKSEPEFAFYISRAGFTADRSNALMYVGVVSWKDASKSQGNYFFLKQKHGEWVIMGQHQIWKF